MSNVKVPDWVNSDQFLSVVRQVSSDFKSFISFNATPAIVRGENYLTNVLSIEAGIKLQDNSCVSIKFILKVPLQCDEGIEHNFHVLFVAEMLMYKEIIPELEEIWKKYAGENILFKPRNFEFTTPPNCDYLLMEDLREQGFKNLNRLTGLKFEKIVTALKKLAQWHAASIKRVEIHGEYDASLKFSFFNKENHKMLDDMNGAFAGPFLECMQHYELTEEHKTLISEYISKLTESYIEFGYVDPRELNVLNHGDFWCNNFMFHGDDVRFVDYQLPKYGTPAHDLFCLLMTSPELDIKLSQFDNFIEIYHKELLKNVSKLKCQLDMPTLTEFHENLQRHGLWAFVCAQRILPAILLESDEDSNAENFLNDSEAGRAFKSKILMNSTYVEQIKVLLPWLIERKYIS